jgi:hypothetical protein
MLSGVATWNQPCPHSPESLEHEGEVVEALNTHGLREVEKLVHCVVHVNNWREA